MDQLGEKLENPFSVSNMRKALDSLRLKNNQYRNTDFEVETTDKGRLDGNPMRIENFELVGAETEPYIYLFEFTNDDNERALEQGRIIK